MFDSASNSLDSYTQHFFVLIVNGFLFSLSINDELFQLYGKMCYDFCEFV